MKCLRGTTIICILLVAVLSGAGCSSFRSDIHGAYGGTAHKRSGMKMVDVLFRFTHERQTKGLDVIPKLEKRHQPVSGFDDILADALKELGNVGNYATFTDRAGDVNEPARRALKDSLTASHDYVVHLTFRKESSFARNFLGTVVSSVTVTLIPVPYKRTYAVHASVKRGDGTLVREYDRSASVTTWVQAGLFVLYPFHTEKRKTEEIYVAFLHDIFRQVESDGILEKM